MNYAEPKKEHITVRRTYALLRGALLQQLAVLPLEQITLTEICSTSLISRSTFYRYFEDKYDLLRYCLRSLMDEIGLTAEVISFQDEESFRRFLTILIEHIGQNKAVYQKIYQTNKEGDLIRFLRKGLGTIMTDTLTAAQKPGHETKIALPILATLLSDLYFSIIRCYLEEADNYTSEEFINNVCLFIAKDFFKESGTP